MLTTVPYDRLEPARWPWVTFAVALAWLAGFALHGLLEPRLALAPGALTAPALLGHWLLSESAVQLLVGIGLLCVLGPVLEEAWGRPFYAVFLLAMALYTAGVYVTFPPATPRPLVGGAGLLAALLGAVVARQIRDGVDYTLVYWAQGVRDLRFWVPAYALPGVWFAGEVAMELAAAGSGPTRGLSYVGQGAGLALGALVGFSLREYGLEQSLLNRRPADAPDPAVEQAQLLVRGGSPEAALRALEPAVARRPHDPELVTGLCEAAVACGDPGAAKSAFAQCVKHHLKSGEAAPAAALWARWAEALEPGPIDGRLAVRLADALVKRGAGIPAARLLRDLLDAPGRVSTGMALRVVEIARPVHAGVAIRAATLALEGGDFPEAKRARLEAIVRELEARRADTLDPELGAAKARPDRSIEIEIEDEDLSRPPAELPRSMPDQIEVPGLSDELDEPTTTTASPAKPPPAPEPEALELRDDLFGSSEEIELASPEMEMDTAPTYQSVPVGVSAAAAPHADPAEPASAGTAPPLMPPVAPPAAAEGQDAPVTTPRFPDAKCIEVVPVELQPGRISLRKGGASPAWLDLSQVQALATAGVAGLAAKPVVVIDLLMNWNELREEPLRVLRLRSDRFDPARLAPGNPGGLEGFRAIVDALLAESGAAPLPDPESARGRPFARFERLEQYEREVLDIER